MIQAKSFLRLRIALPAAAGVLALVACGQTGALYLPEDSGPVIIRPVIAGPVIAEENSPGAAPVVDNTANTTAEPGTTSPPQG
ncbi:MAG: hypothetical protein FJ154_04320 [Gammaproteobacteria bacterium]|jgi:hypothetical protein|nr:hypothetical protein [Gammaproteobacteria bacterium]